MMLTFRRCKACIAGKPSRADGSGSLLDQHNPTCDSGKYSGGLSCCSHKRVMLDADQVLRPELLRYHMKIRFWCALDSSTAQALPPPQPLARLPLAPSARYGTRPRQRQRVSNVRAPEI